MNVHSRVFQAASAGQRAIESLGIGLAVVLFGLSVRGRPLPVPIAVVSLVLAAILLWRAMAVQGGIAAAMGSWRTPRGKVLWLLFSGVVGQLLSTYWRWALGVALVPSHFTGFAIVAALIGAIEEILFRGFVQGSILPSSPAGAVVAAAVLHTAYKLSLFVSPPSGEMVNSEILLTYTLAGGMLFGAMRGLSGSVWPCVVAHAVFDIMGYGDRAGVPSWVWH